MIIGVLFGNFCSSCFIKISVSFYVKITFFPDFFDDLTPVAMESYYQCSNPDSNEKNWTGHIRPLNIIFLPLFVLQFQQNLHPHNVTL